MDPRIETLVRRDQNGRPLPPTQAEIANWSANYGPNRAKAAVKEIQDIQDKARVQEQAAGDNALKVEQARAAIEATKAQAALAKQKADTEAAAQAQETEKTRLANTEKQQKQDAAKAYLEGTTGQIMQGMQAPAAVAGGLGGYFGAKGIGSLQNKSAQGANEERQKAAADFERINPATATPAEYQAIHTGAKQSGLIPSTGPLSSVQRGVKRYLPYVGAAGAFGVEGALMRYLANQEDQPSLKKDIMNDFGTVGFGLGAGALGKGAVYALYPPTHPDASALAKIELAKLKAREVAANNQPPTQDARQLPPPVEPYKGTPTHVARVVADDLGLANDIQPKDTKADIVNRSLAAIRSGTATPEQVATVVRKFKGIEPEKALGDLLTRRNRLGAIAGALGVGAAAAAGAPGEAEAGPAREESLPHYRARQLGEGALNALDIGSYALPGVGEARTAYDIGSAAGEAYKNMPSKSVTQPPYNPRSKAYSDWAQAVRPEKEPAGPPVPPPPHEEIGAEAAHAVPSEVGPGIDRRVGKGTVGGESQSSAFVNPEQHGFNPEHLPSHEQGLIDNPEEAIHRASWQLPYLATGRHMVGLTGDPDTFFGGKTPEHQQIYDDTLKANKAFYENAFKRLANKSPHSTPDQPVADEAPVAKEGFRHGGSVNRKVISIHDAFKRRLENQERKIKALEKAHARKSTPKLTERLAQEKDEAKRIREHLERVKMHA